jgi:tetratricopeptide (TPR) repeat protein
MPNRLLDRHGPSVVCLALALSPALVRAQAPPKTADHSQEAYIIEQTRTLLRFEADGTGRREMYMRLRTQNEAGVQEWGQLVVGYNAASERPDISFVRVRKPDGSVVTTPSESVQDLTSPVERLAPIYTDFRQKHVTVQSLRPGDTLEFQVVTTIHTALAPGQFWTEYDFNRQAIVLDELLEIDVPADRAITLKTTPGHDPATREDGGRHIYQWTRSNLARPDPKEEEKKEKEAEEKPSEPKVAAVRLTTFQSWEEVGRWWASLESPQRAPSPEIRKKSAELIAGRKTDLEKIEALYEYVATSFRYVSLSLGMGRYQPRTAADVLREQYGDCKDKHTLLASLIEAAGLRASAVLIHSETKLDPAFPSPSQFDHVITKARAGNEDVWVDATSGVAPFRLLPPQLRKKQALVVDGGAMPRLEETPPNPPTPSFMQTDVEATLAETGSLKTKASLVFRGDIEFLMRIFFRSVPPADWKAAVERFGEIGGRKGEVSDWKVSDPAALKDPFRIDLTVSFPSFVSWNSGKAAVPLPFTEEGQSPDNVEVKDGRIVLGAAPMEVSYKLRLQFPPEVTVRAPLPISIARDYAEYRASYTTESSMFLAERALRIKQSELPLDRREDHAALLRVIVADSRQQLALRSASATTTSVTTDLSAEELTRNGAAAFKARNYTEAVTLLKRAVELDPKEKTAWNHLGLAYSALRQHDSAIDAYRKQIEVNPYDAQAHNYLGHTYVLLNKVDEAEAAFKKQIELNPLDQYAPGSLASLYLQQRNYEAALAQLERAVTLRPDDPWVQLQLGKAQLNLKHETEAMAAFDRAVELAPNPTTWNDIAYELSQKAVHLDRALQYAESAVSTAAAASRTLDGSRLDAKAIQLANSLAAYWDTLGWVHFARGDLARAEPLVEASWRLAQHSEVGDHLAQIYEKTGRREEAIMTYAMALGAERPTEEIRKRFAALLGDRGSVDAEVARHSQALMKARMLQLTTPGVRGKTAEVAILFSSAAGVESVKLVGGDESLRALEADIRKLPYGRMFPDDPPAKVLRKGIVSCPPLEGACTLILVLPRDTDPVK